MDGLIVKSPKNENISYVKSAMVYLTDEYANKLYNSCANVQFAGGGAKVMNILCGTPNCNASKFLAFQGNPALNSDNSPFLISYTINDTYTGDENITILDDTGIHNFYSCNDSVPGEGPCSCSDCPITCPLPPTFPNSSRSHFPSKIYTFSVGGVGLILSTIIFIAALTSTVYMWVVHKRDGYHPIAGSDSPPLRSTYGITDTSNSSRDKKWSTNFTDVDFEENGSGNVKQSIIGHLCQISHHVERMLKRAFYHWGKFVTKFWYIVLITTIVLTTVLSCGLHYSSTTGPVELWSASCSPMGEEMNYYNKYFGPSHRTEQIIVKAKPFVRGFNISVIFTTVVWTFGPVFNKSVLEEVSFYVYVWMLPTQVLHNIILVPIFPYTGTPASESSHRNGSRVQRQRKHH